MFTTSNSSRSTSRSGQSDHGPMPSFVVTSSNDTPFTHATTPVKAMPTAALNPEAREFRITPSFGGSLFAMPAAAALSPPRWTPTSTHNFPCRPSGSPQSSPLPSSASPAAAGALDSSRLVEFTEAYMHELYDHKCREEGLHMVSVFHLHPRTTNKQLSSMFFPTGACAAEVLEPRQMPEPLANAFNLVRQRAGAVFFARKDFAMVGVEKIHDFVPHGQHQPLRVRYCGPDTSATPPTVPPLLVSKAKASSPSGARPTSAQSNFRDPIAACAAVSATQSLAPLDRLGGTADSAAVPSNTYDVIDQHFLQKYAGDQVYLVGVHNLAYGTSAKSFYKMFYPMGALDSELLPRPVSVDGKLRCSGVAIFASKGMAIEAAEKINDFVPHGQRRPVVARFLDRTLVPMQSVAATSASATAAGERREAQQHGTPPATASTPRANASHGASSTAAAAADPPVTSASALLFAIERQLRAKAVSDSQLAADMCALVLCNDSGEAEAKKLADILRETLQSMGDHSTILSSPLSGAFRTMHSTLGIRTRTALPSPVDDSAAVKKAVMFLRLIGRTFMMLVADTAAARQTRIVAAVQCAYLYQYTYLPKTPLCFATVLFQNCSKELKEAKEFLCREAEVPSSIEEERQHRLWITLMDALQEMVRVWKSLDPRMYAQDSAREDYERFVRDFRDADPCEARSLMKASVDQAEAGAEACTPRNDALEASRENANAGSGSGSRVGLGSISGNGASSSAKKSQLVTPSARPTPRRVVSKSYSTTASDWKGKQTTPVGNIGGAVPPQVMLSSPASDYTQGASEFSAESSTVGPFNSALRSFGLTPQHTGMRFTWGSRVCGTTTHLSTPPPAPTVSAVPMPPTAATPSSVASAAGAERSDAAMTECTVYITKLPSCFTSGQVRRLLLHFGDFRKVRLCHDDKETTRCGTAEAVAAHQLKFHALCFGFVEFVEAGSARAMIECFRNEAHTPTAFDFLRTPDAVVFDETELHMLRSTRTSQARNPIHDQQPIDATRTTPCFFGLIKPEHTIETYAEAVTVDDVAAAVRALEAAQQPPIQQAPVTVALGRVGVFATAASPTPTAAPSVASLQPMEDVHFPKNFPFHHVFARACDDDNNGAPVLVEDDDDDELQEYQVQQILQLLN